MKPASSALDPTVLANGEAPRFDGRYRLLGDLGKGGFGRVHLVADELCDGERRALKVVLDEHQQDADFARRFRNEIHILRALHHPGIPQIYNDGRTAEGELYYTMDFVAGITLEAILCSEGPLSPARSIRLIQHILLILEYAHARGVVHRDLKPNNIMIVAPGTPEERVVLLDFGIAKLIAPGAKEALATLAAMGTPHYMAPEQVEGSEIDGRCDLYGLGVILYRMISNRLPFGGETPMEIAVARLQQRPTPLEDTTFSGPFRELVERMLARDKHDRPSTIEIRRCLDGMSGNPQASHSRLGMVALAVCVAGAALVAAWPEGESCEPRPPSPSPATPSGALGARMEGDPARGSITSGESRQIDGGAFDRGLEWSSALALERARSSADSPARESGDIDSGGAATPIEPAQESGSVDAPALQDPRPLGGPDDSDPPIPTGELRVNLGRDRYYLILDASGSMHARIDGEEKLALVVQELARGFDLLPSSTEVAVRVFGHRRSSAERGADRDTELCVPFETIRPGRMRARLSALRPGGQSPVGLALRESEADLVPLAGAPVSVILLAEGGQRIFPPDRGLDPALEALALSELAGVRFHVVGFTTEPTESESLSHIARQGRGQFWSAPDAATLRRCLEQVLVPPPAEFRLVGPGDFDRNFPFDSSLPVLPGEYTLEATRGTEVFRLTVCVLPDTVLSIDLGAAGFRGP